MGRECYIGFAELFELAKRRPWEEAERTAFYGLDQHRRNIMVKGLAIEAGCIETEDRQGTDGLVYTAFWVQGPEWYEECIDNWSVPLLLTRMVPPRCPVNPACFVVTKDYSPYFIPRQVLGVGFSRNLAEMLASTKSDSGTEPDRGTIVSLRLLKIPLYIRWLEHTQAAKLAQPLKDFLQPQH